MAGGFAATWNHLARGSRRGRLCQVERQSWRRSAAPLSGLCCPGTPTLPLYQPTMLLTLPGALQQHWHRDANQDDVYSVLIAVTDRDFWFKERGLLHLRAGDLLIFKGSMCHAGAELARDAGEASIALHIYGGNGITADVLASLFTDSACRGHPETA